MHFGEGVDATGAADEDLAVILGVDIDEAFMFEHAILQFHCAGQPCLFIDGKETLDSRVRQVRIGDSGKCHRNTNTIVRTEGGSFGFEPLAIHVGLDRITHEIVLHIPVFLRYHIHVRLQDDALMVFVSGCSRNTHNDVHRFIRDALDLMVSGEIL